MNNWKETLSILLISFSFIALILFIQPNKAKESEFKTRIPKSTTEHYFFNASYLIKKLVFDELFVHEDEVLFQKVKELVSKESKTETSFSDLNIDYTAPLEVISFKKNEKAFTALKFRISEPEKFDQNEQKLRKSLLFRDKLNAYWVLGELKSNKTLFQKYIINNSFEYKIKNDESKQFVSRFRNSKLVSFGWMQAKDNLLKIEQKNIRAQTHMSLKPKGFHLTTEINSSQFGSLQENRISELIHLKELKHISLNYLGLNFIDDSEIQAIPKFEVLLCYKNKISGDSITSNFLKHVDLPFEIISKELFQLGQQSLKIKQIDTNLFVISTLNDFELTKTCFSPFITGDPKNIVKISNAGWKGLFLELIPAFKSSKNLLESTTKISTYQNKQGYHIICLSFKKNEDALHSLLKFALNLQ